MTQCEFGGLDPECTASPATEADECGVRGLSVKLTVPLTGCVTLSKSLNLPEAAAKC